MKRNSLIADFSSLVAQQDKDLVLSLQIQSLAWELHKLLETEHEPYLLLIPVPRGTGRVERHSSAADKGLPAFLGS